jgi:AraC-like DNA-binding protein
MCSMLQVRSVRGIEDFQEGVRIRGSQVEATKLTCDPFAASLTFARLARGMLSGGTYSGQFQVRGPLSTTNLSLGVLLRAEGQSSQWHYETKSGDIGVFPPCAEHEARYGGAMSQAILTLPVEEVLDWAAYDQPPILGEAYLDRAAMYRPPPSMARLVVNRFETALREIVQEPKILQTLNARDEMFENLLRSFVSGVAMAGPWYPRPRRAFVIASRTVCQVEDYLREHRHRPVRLAEICRALGLSRRSLHRAFCEVFDIPPATYLRRWRLSRVRTMLAATEPGGMTVTDAALHWGFWELGRFAEQYRQVFGELPSETLHIAKAGINTGRRWSRA